MNDQTNTAVNITLIETDPIRAQIHAENCEGQCVQFLFDGLLSQWLFADASVLRINGSMIEAYPNMEACQNVIIRELQDLEGMPKPGDNGEWGPL